MKSSFFFLSRVHAKRTEAAKSTRTPPEPLRIQSMAAGESIAPSFHTIPHRVSHQAADPKNTPATRSTGENTGPRLVKIAEKLRMVMGLDRVRKKAEMQEANMPSVRGLMDCAAV